MLLLNHKTLFRKRMVFLIYIVMGTFIPRSWQEKQESLASKKYKSIDTLWAIIRKNSKKELILPVLLSETQLGLAKKE